MLAVRVEELGLETEARRRPAVLLVQAARRWIEGRAGAPGDLTPREREVWALVAGGLTNPQIAERLLMGRATVKTHLDHVFTKLGMRTRAELAAEAARRSMV